MQCSWSRFGAETMPSRVVTNTAISHKYWSLYQLSHSHSALRRLAEGIGFSETITQTLWHKRREDDVVCRWWWLTSDSNDKAFLFSSPSDPLCLPFLSIRSRELIWVVPVASKSSTIRCGPVERRRDAEFHRLVVGGPQWPSTLPLAHPLLNGLPLRSILF